MKNVEMKVEGSKLVITVNLDENQGPSKSQKSIIIGTTGGNVGVPGMENARVGVTVYTKV